MKKTVPFILLIILFAGAIWYSLMKKPDPVHEIPPPSVAPVLPDTSQQAQSQPQIDSELVYPDSDFEPEPLTPPAPLPVLTESDAEVRQALGEIAGPEPVLEYLVMDQVISRTVASIDSLTSRQVPVHINPIRPAGDKFLIDTDGETLVLSGKNFARYDGYVELLQNMNTDSLISVYRRYSPLFQQAWEENGGTGSFNDRLIVVIDNLLETPDVPGPVYLAKSEAVYLFENPELEAMTAGQKVLVRMGSVNASVVKEKLAELRAALNP